MTHSLCMLIGELARLAMLTNMNFDCIKLLSSIEDSISEPAKLYSCLAMEALGNNQVQLAIDLVNKANQIDPKETMSQYMKDVLTSSSTESLKAISEIYISDSTIDPISKSLIEMVSMAI